MRNVFLIDDEPSVRSALRFLLESSAFNVTEFESGSSFLEWWDDQATQPRGIILLDVRMDGLSGLQVHDALIERGVFAPIIFLSGHADISMAVDSIKRGAFDFLEKPASDNSLVERIEYAIAKEEVAFQNFAQLSNFAKCWTSLTAREKTLAPLIAAGRLNKQIAADLGLSVRTVEVFRSRVFEKMGLRSAAELATAMEKHGAKE